MRKIEFNELKLKNTYDEETFYQFYLANPQKELIESNYFNEPNKLYEIFYLNILGGKIILLNKDYIQNNDTSNQELYYDYKTAIEIYTCLLDIYDGIESEQNEINELYKEERLQLDKKINELIQKDEKLFNTAIAEYNTIKNSKIYEEYIYLKEENQKLKKQIKELTKELPVYKNNNNIIQKIINKFKKISNGEK